MANEKPVDVEWAHKFIEHLEQNNKHYDQRVYNHGLPTATCGCLGHHAMELEGKTGALYTAATVLEKKLGLYPGQGSDLCMSEWSNPRYMNVFERDYAFHVNAAIAQDFVRWILHGEDFRDAVYKAARRKKPWFGFKERV